MKRGNEDNFALHKKEEDPDGVTQRLINRFLRAKWIDAVVELPEEVNFHFTPLGKKRFRELHASMQELLNNKHDLLDGDERSELLAMVEAWIQDVEEQRD